MKLRSFRLVFPLLLFVAHSSFAFQSQQSSSQSQQPGNKCSVLLAPHKAHALPGLEDKPLSAAEAKKITSERACELSYRFPGEDNAVLSATPEKIRADFVRFQSLFEIYRQLPQTEKEALKSIPDAGDGDNTFRVLGFSAFESRHPGLSTGDILRLEGISKGLKKEQAALYGRLFIIQSLRLHGRFREAAQMFDQMRKTLLIRDHPLDHGDLNSYFSEQTLRNLIAVNGYAAKAKLPGGLGIDGDLIADYLDNREALLPLLGAEWPSIKSPNPDFMLSRLQDTAGLGIRTQQWDKAHRLSHLVGSSPDGQGTLLFIKGEHLHAVAVSDSHEPKVLDSEEAGAKLEAFYKREVRENSTANMTLFTVLKYDDGSFEVQLGEKSITISSDEFATLESGRPLPPSHALSASLADVQTVKVLYANPLMQFAGQELTNADEFVFAVQKSYPSVPIYRDPFSDDTGKKVDALRAFTLSGPTSVTAIVAAESFRPRVDEFNAIKGIETVLQNAGVDVVEFKNDDTFRWKPNGRRALIVITGHSNEALAEFVRAVGSTGAFKDNYVLFNSCATQLSRDLISEINSRYGAVGTFAHASVIKPEILRESMVSLTEKLNVEDKTRFDELLTTTFNVNGLNGVWTISMGGFAAPALGKRDRGGC